MCHDFHHLTSRVRMFVWVRCSPISVDARIPCRCRLEYEKETKKGLRNPVAGQKAKHHHDVSGGYVAG